MERIRNKGVSPIDSEIPPTRSWIVSSVVWLHYRSSDFILSEKFDTEETKTIILKHNVATIV